MLKDITRNDSAAALSAATVGIAVHGGAEASLSAADVFATTAGLSPVVELVLGARRTLGVIRGNLARSLVYNLTVGTLAATGFVGPLLADPPLVDYMSSLMMRFARLDTVHRVRKLTGRPVDEVADMLVEAEGRIGLARSDVHRPIGD